jgi:hypothetical protein
MRSGLWRMSVLPKRPKEHAIDVIKAFGVDHLKAPELHPDATAAVNALHQAAFRLMDATNPPVAVATVRLLADTFEKVWADRNKRPPHRPKGAVQYDREFLRRAMAWAERQPIPQDSGFRSPDAFLAYVIHSSEPRKHGQDARAIYKRICLLRAEDEKLRQTMIKILATAPADSADGPRGLSALASLARSTRPPGDSAH